MKKITSLLLLLFIATIAFSQTTINRDKEIDQMVKEASADSIQSYIGKMVAFGTRNTLSTQKDAKHGIGAAKNWVLKKFNEFARQSNGRLTATIDATSYKAD